MSTTVASAGFEVTSTHESAEDMVSALTPKDESPEPRVIVDKGVKVEEKPKEGLSKAASELGKVGGKAAAEARKAQAQPKDAKVETRGSDDDPEQEEEPEPEAAKEKDRRGDPRFDPKARVAEATREAREAKQAAAAAAKEASELRRRLEASERARTAPEPQERRQAPTQAQDDDPAPESGNYERHDDFVRDTSLWAARKTARENARQAEVHARAHQEASQRAQSIDAAIGGFRNAIAEAEKADPNFREGVSDEVANVEPTFTLPDGARHTGANWIADQFFRKPSEAPALMKYLSDQPEEFQRVAALSSPSEVTWELANIHARLNAATAGTSDRREVSKASPPVTPVTGSPAIADGPRYREGQTTLDDYARGWKDPRKR